MVTLAPLDPMASGVLVMHGQSTRLVRFMMEGSKRYVAEVMLGTATDSGDADGEVTEALNLLKFARTCLSSLLSRFWEYKAAATYGISCSSQRSASYEYAREGIEVEREARSVTIFSIEPLDLRRGPEVLRNGDVVKLEVECSKGTYIRTLARHQ